MTERVWQKKDVRRNVASLSAIAIFLFVSSGCAIQGNSAIPTDFMATDQIVTNSVASSTVVEGVDASDADLIKATIINSKSANTKKPINWKNEVTGSSGTVVSIDSFKGKHGQECRGFKTSVDTYAGISFYDGETCRVAAGKWVLSWFKPAG